MHVVKKKTVQIFANGSLVSNDTFFKQSYQIKIYNKDHTTSSFYQKKSNIQIDLKNFIHFKAKYLNFLYTINEYIKNISFYKA